MSADPARTSAYATCYLAPSANFGGAAFNNSAGNVPLPRSFAPPPFLSPPPSLVVVLYVILHPCAHLLILCHIERITSLAPHPRRRRAKPVDCTNSHACPTQTPGLQQIRYLSLQHNLQSAAFPTNARALLS